MQTFIQKSPKDPIKFEKELKKEREKIHDFQERVDELSDVFVYMPSISSFEPSNPWFEKDSMNEVIVNVNVPVPVDNLEIARFKLFQVGYACQLNTKKIGLYVGTLTTGEDVYCHKYYIPPTKNGSYNTDDVKIIDLSDQLS